MDYCLHVKKPFQMKESNSKYTEGHFVALATMCNGKEVMNATENQLKERYKADCIDSRSVDYEK